MCTPHAESLRIVVQDEEVIITHSEMKEVTWRKDAGSRDYVAVTLHERAAKRIEDATARHLGGTMSIFWGDELLQADIPIRESFAPGELQIVTESETAARRIVESWNR
jgi:preprotein translocase subunit SecD